MDANSQWSFLIFKGNVIKEEKVTYQFTKISHIAAIFIFLLAFVTKFTLSVMNKLPSSKEIDGFYIFGSFFTGFLCLFGGLLFPKILNSILASDRSKVGTSVNHLFQLIFFFLLFPLLVFSMDTPAINEMLGMLPLFILSGIGLIMTYPTKKRWAKWTRKTNIELYP
jgi:hypothetical protein